MLKIANQAHYHKALARQLVEQINPMIIDEDYRLQIDDSMITLCSIIDRQKTCFSHSFTETHLIRRATQKNQALLKACNNKRKTIQRIIDLTAGWGKDSFILASHGHQVSMIEHQPLIYHCLDYLIKSARQEQPESAAANMAIQLADSYEFLQHNDIGAHSCLYLDPMFPAHKSSAKPGKDLQLLQQLTQNRSIEALFDKALESKPLRVVVKRPLHAPVLNDLKPDICYREKTIRFDVYLPGSAC